MLSAVIAIILIRLESEPGAEAAQASAMLTELFVADMDESLHQIGLGDYVVGKHVGRMMGALGGRLGAFRQAARDREFAAPVRRNIYHDDPPSEELVALVAARLERFDSSLLGAAVPELIAGRLPAA